MRSVGVLLAWMFVLGRAASAHEITFSHIEVRLQPGQTQVSVQLPITALLQQQPPPLPAGTTQQALQTAPLRADVQASLTQLVTARLRLKADGRTVPLAVVSVLPAGDDIALAARAPPMRGVLDVEANLFPDDTLHKVFVNVYRADTLAGQYALDRQNPAITLDAPERPLREVIVTFVHDGIHHIFIGPDHILFVLALVLLGVWLKVRSL